MKSAKRVRIAACLGAISLTTSLEAHASLIESLPLNGTTTALVGADAVAFNNPTPAAGVDGSPNGSMAFQSISYYGTYVSVPDGGGLSGASDGTISMWVRWNGIQRQTAFENVYGAATGRQQDGSASDDIIGLNGADPNTSEVSFQFGNQTGVALTGSTPVGDGVWHDLAITFTPTTENLYLDGSLDGSVSGSFGQNSVNDAALTIGAWAGSGAGYSTSDIADVQIFNTALSPADLTASVPEPASLAAVTVTSLGILARRRRPLIA